MQYRLKRDPAIEFARILGCLIVIGVHTALPHMVNGHVDNSRLFIEMLLADGVAIFWMIAGCFMFATPDYKRVIFRTIKTVVIPLFMVSIVLLMLDGWLYNDMLLSESIKNPPITYEDMLQHIIRWENFAPNAVHLWYLYAYTIVMLCFPVLKSFVDYLDESPKRQKLFLILTFVLLVLNDISLNELWCFSHHTFGAAIPAAIEAIWGHIVYQYRYKFHSSRVAVESLITFLLLNVFRLFIQIDRFAKGVQNNRIMFWYSSFGLLCSACVLLFSLSIFQNRVSSQKNQFVCKLASYTYSIYLVHVTIRNLMFENGFREAIAGISSCGISGFANDVLYSIIVVMTIFAVSLLVSMLWSTMIKFISKGLAVFYRVILHNKGRIC